MQTKITGIKFLIFRPWLIYICMSMKIGEGEGNGGVVFCKAVIGDDNPFILTPFFPFNSNYIYVGLKGTVLF